MIKRYLSFMGFLLLLTSQVSTPVLALGAPQTNDPQALTKAQKKENKKAQKVFTRTKTKKNEEENYTTISGPQKKVGWGMNSGFVKEAGGSGFQNDIYWHLRSFKFESNPSQHQIFIYFRTTVSYPNFTLAILPEGEGLIVTPIAQEKLNCGMPGGCRRTESIAINLRKETLMDRYENGLPIDFMVASLSGTKIMMSIPAYYVKGFMDKGKEALGLFKDDVR